jgi:malate dehydrogenase
MAGSMGARGFSTSGLQHTKVAVLGAAGGIGQPMSLLLKDSDRISRLALFDIVRTPGVAADLSHINSPAQVTGHMGMEEIGKALDGSDVVVIPAGVPRKPGMTRDDLFSTNASIVQSLAEACTKHCPKAKTLVISNPVNSTVPIVAEVYKKAGVYDPRKVIGVTTLDICRANTFVAESQGWNVRDTHVNVIGGHAGTTILPLLSQVKGATFTEEQVKSISHRIQFGGDEVVQAKAGEGSATLSMAYAGAQFTEQLLRAMMGHKGVVECCFTGHKVHSDVDYFSTMTLLGPDGAEEALPYGDLSAFEEANMAAMLPDLAKQIQKGIAFVTK